MAGCDGKAEAAKGLLELFGDRIRESRVIGVGTGSTVARAVKALHREGLLAGKTLVASSIETMLLLAELGYAPLTPLSVGSVDFYFDGADEVDPQGRLLKGRGGAMLGEKVIASIAEARVYVVDESKLVERLGSRRPVPLEVSQPAVSAVVRLVGEMGFRAEIRRGEGKDGPVVSDWGGVIVDVHTGPLKDPEGVESALESLPGVAASGLFTRLKGAVVVGYRGCGYRLLG